MVESTVAVNCTKKEIVENVVETKAINVVKACVILKLTLLMRNNCFLKTIFNMFQSS